MSFKRIIIAFLCLFLASNVFAVKRYGAVLCQKHSEYDCYTAVKGDNWQKLFPVENQRNLVKRVNRVNIKLRKGMVIAVPKNLNEIDYFDISPFPLYRDTEGKKLVVFDPAKLAWAAYAEDGALINWGPASGGKGWCSDVKRGCRTSQGEYSFYHKRGAYCRSGKYPIGKGGAPMPYCMFFYRGFAFHGSPIVPGYHASHGCVRIFNEDAEWLHKNFVSTKNKTKVIVMKYKPKFDLPKE